MNLHLFTRFSSRPRHAEATFRPIFDDLEGRVVMSMATMAAPVAVAAQISARAESEVNVSVPLSISKINFTQITEDATTDVMTAVGTLTGSLLGQTFKTRIMTAITPPETAGDVPLLRLQLNKIRLDLFGVNISTSSIRLDITARPGPGNTLGNLLAGLPGLLDSPATEADPMSALRPLNSMLNNRTLLRGLNNILVKETNDAGAPRVTGPSTNILKLSIDPIERNQLGLDVGFGNGAGGPVTVAFTTDLGPAGDLLDKLFASVARLLDNPGNNTEAITSKTNKILSLVRLA